VNVTGGQLPPLTREEKQARYERQQMKDYALVILANLNRSAPVGCVSDYRLRLCMDLPLSAGGLAS
jgi:hypothetical protein